MTELDRYDATGTESTFDSIYQIEMKLSLQYIAGVIIKCLPEYILTFSTDIYAFYIHTVYSILLQGSMNKMHFSQILDYMRDAQQRFLL